MKKLIMTTVAALGFAALAQADVLNSTGFEDYGDNKFDVGTSDSGIPDSGKQYWTGKGDFSQTELKTYAKAKIDPPENVPDAFTNAASNATFLSVDTGSDVMYRRVVANPTDTFDLSNGKPVFFDADVKFTASETPVVPSEGDKLLVWLKGDDTTTNLIVTAGILDDRGVVTTNETFVTDADVEADTWYRLTVKAGVDDKNCTYFNVYIDGKQVSATYKDGVFNSFPSLVESGSDSGKLIEAAGFQGTGALDNVVWTTTDPFPPEATYTLAVTIEDEDGSLSAITVNGTVYEINEQTSLEIPFLASTKTLEVKASDIFEGMMIQQWNGVSTTITVADELKDGRIALTLTVVEDARIDVENATVIYSINADTIKVGDAAPTVTSVTVNEAVLTLGTDYTVTSVGTVEAVGEYKLIIDGKGAYKGQIQKTFTVTAAEPTTVVTPTAAEIESGKITVTEETTAIKVGGVDVSIDAFDVNAGVATVKAPVVAESAEAAGDAFVIDDKNDEVTINVNPVAGLYYGVSAATDLDALARPASLTQYDGTNATEIFTVSKPGDEKGFFKVYSDVKK